MQIHLETALFLIETQKGLFGALGDAEGTHQGEGGSKRRNFVNHVPPWRIATRAHP